MTNRLFSSIGRGDSGAWKLMLADAARSCGTEHNSGSYDKFVTNFSGSYMA